MVNIILAMGTNTEIFFLGNANWDVLIQQKANNFTRSCNIIVQKVDYFISLGKNSVIMGQEYWYPGKHICIDNS